jgi:transglutaminase-like putative cysteine protease
MDRQSWVAGDGKVYRGIPMYLMDGYTDMGLLPSPTERAGREKIKVDKERMREQLLSAKHQRILAASAEIESLLARYYDLVRRDIEFDEKGVDQLSREFGSESIVLSEYLDKGLGVCRHLSIVYQVYLQEAGIPSRVVKGNLRFYVFNGRHAWNLIWLPGRLVLADVTHPNVNRPFIVTGATEEDVYRQAQEFSRLYTPTPDDQNHYKIGNHEGSAG